MHVKTQVKPGGKMYFTQTFQEKKLWIADILKPIAKWISTVDFGHTTYEHEFLSVLNKAGVKLENMEVMSSGFMNTTTMRLVTVNVC